MELIGCCVDQSEAKGRSTEKLYWVSYVRGGLQGRHHIRQWWHMGLCLMKRAIRWASPLAMSWTLAQLLKVARTRRWVVLMLDSDESDFRLWLVSRIDHCCGTCILGCLEGLMQFRLFQHNVCSPAKNSCCRCVWCGKQDQHAFVCCHLKELPESCLLQFLEIVVDQLLLAAEWTWVWSRCITIVGLKCGLHRRCVSRASDFTSNVRCLSQA